jgi:hypothetical protein
MGEPNPCVHRDAGYDVEDFSCRSDLRNYRRVLRANPANRENQEFVSAVVPIGERSTPRLLYLRKPRSRDWERIDDRDSRRHARFLCGKTL